MVKKWIEVIGLTANELNIKKQEQKLRLDAAQKALTAFEAALPAQIEQIESKIGEISEQLSILNKEKEAAKDKAKEAEKNGESKNSCQRAIKVVRQIEAEIRLGRDEKEKAQQEIVDLQNKLQRLKNRLEEAENNLADTEKEINGQKARFEATNRALQANKIELAQKAGVPKKYLNSVSLTLRENGGYTLLYGEEPNSGKIIVTKSGEIIPIQKTKEFFAI